MEHNCDVCGGNVDDRVAWEQDQLEKHGWYAHLVSDDHTTPYGFNCHTHGWVENLNHPDVQVVLPIPPDTAMGILHNIADRIRKGDSFHHGQTVSEIIRGYDVLFINATESERNILRIIFPDKAGNLEPQLMDEQFSHQHCL